MANIILAWSYFYYDGKLYINGLPSINNDKRKEAILKLMNPGYYFWIHEFLGCKL